MMLPHFICCDSCVDRKPGVNFVQCHELVAVELRTLNDLCLVDC